MAKRNDPSQGMVANPKALGKATRVPEPDTAALLRGDQRALNKKDAELTRPRPAQKLAYKQDWRKG